MSLDHNASLRQADPVVAGLVDQELRRQQSGLELIASENFASRAVIDAMGTPLTNKYAEGYPGRRYYGGCEVIDQIEQLAIDRLKQLFGAEHANVQPHSGAQANFAAFMAVIQPGETIMGMSLPHGGHLSHGAAVNHSGSGVARGALRRRPRHRADRLRRGPPAGARRAAQAAHRRRQRIRPHHRLPVFRSIADEVGAIFLVDMAHFAGLVAGGVHPSPVPHAQIVTSTTHKTLRGPRAGLILSTAEHAKAIDKSVFPGTQGGPLEHVIAAKAVAFGEALTADFKAYARRVVENAQTLADALVDLGYAIVSGGTDTHLMLVDLRPKNLTGKAAEKTLDEAGITVNKNTVPDDPQSPFVTSGIRLGTPAVTTRGMGRHEMRRVAQLIDEALTRPEEQTLARVRGEVRELTAAYPLYQPATTAAGVRRSA